MPPLTSRIRLNLQQKQKIIEESKKPGFNPKKSKGGRNQDAACSDACHSV